MGKKLKTPRGREGAEGPSDVLAGGDDPQEEARDRGQDGGRRQEGEDGRPTQETHLNEHQQAMGIER